MEMPVPCCRCGDIVELNDCRTSPYKDDLVCATCYDELSERKDLEDEIQDLEDDLQNDAEYVIGNKRQYRRELKEMKERLSTLNK